MSESKWSRQKARGEAAKRLLENPLIEEWFETVEAEIMETWKRAEMKDERGQLHCKIAHFVAGKYREQFTRWITTGEMAAKELVRQHEKSKLRRVIG